VITIPETYNVSRQVLCDALSISTDVVFTYRPNNRRLELPEGDALLFPARSRVAVQVHLKTGPTDESPDTTPTRVLLWTLPKGERPERRVVRPLFHNFDLTIAVDAVDVEVAKTSELESAYTRAGAEIIGFTPELRYLGQRMHAAVGAADGTSTIMFDFPVWSADARKDYLFEPEKFIPIGPGSALTHRCVYSNRLEDQRLDDNGERMEPQLTVFGEDTRQEMCSVSLYVHYTL